MGYSSERLARRPGRMGWVLMAPLAPLLAGVPTLSVQPATPKVSGHGGTHSSTPRARGDGPGGGGRTRAGRGRAAGPVGTGYAPHPVRGAGHDPGTDGFVGDPVTVTLDAGHGRPACRPPSEGAAGGRRPVRAVGGGLPGRVPGRGARARRLPRVR